MAKKDPTKEAEIALTQSWELWKVRFRFASKVVESAQIVAKHLSQMLKELASIQWEDTTDQ